MFCICGTKVFKALTLFLGFQFHRETWRRQPCERFSRCLLLLHCMGHSSETNIWNLSPLKTQQSSSQKQVTLNVNSCVMKQLVELPFFSFFFSSAGASTFTLSLFLIFAFSTFSGLSRTISPFNINALVKSISEARSTCACFLQHQNTTFY